MRPPTIKNIESSQNQYLELLMQYEEDFQDDDTVIIDICTLLDDVKCFWLERLKIIEYELDELTEAKSCFVLSGAIFLNVSEYEHYFFKSFGDCHIISDPFSKLEMMFRYPEEEINIAYTVDYFKRAFFDTIEILTTYKGYFYVLPIQEIAVEDSKKHREFLDMFFWRFISGAFDDEITSNEDFQKKYKSFEEIEADLSDFVRKHLVFNDIDDSELSLRERLEKYSYEQTNISSYLADISDSQRFLISVSSYISQIANILYICTILGINPYIRFDVTFNYFALVMYTFIEDKKLKDMIEKTLICYIFYKTTDEEHFKRLGFPEYCTVLEEKSFMDSVLDQTRNLDIDIFFDDTAKIASIVEDEFMEYIHKLNAPLMKSKRIMRSLFSKILFGLRYIFEKIRNVFFNSTESVR